MIRRVVLLLATAGLLLGCATDVGRQRASESLARTIPYSIDPRTGFCFAGYANEINAPLSLIPCTPRVLQQIAISDEGRMALQKTRLNGVHPFAWGGYDAPQRTMDFSSDTGIHSGDVITNDDTSSGRDAFVIK